jgi:hypothetical protein
MFFPHNLRTKELSSRVYILNSLFHRIGSDTHPRVERVTPQVFSTVGSVVAPTPKRPPFRPPELSDATRVLLRKSCLLDADRVPHSKFRVPNTGMRGKGTQDTIHVRTRD